MGFLFLDNLHDFPSSQKSSLQFQPWFWSAGLLLGNSSWFCWEKHLVNACWSYRTIEMNQVGKKEAESGRARKDESKPSLGSVPASSDPAEQLPWSPRYWLPPSLWHISHGEPPEGHQSWVHFTRILPSRSQPSLVLTRFFFRRAEWKIGVSCCTFSSSHTFRVPLEVQPWTWAPQGSRNVPSCIGGKTAKQQKKQNKKTHLASSLDTF